METFRCYPSIMTGCASPSDVYIYYKDGGVRKLFRKVRNQSSVFCPGETQVRQNGNYIYEKFYQPDNRADVKVYGVGKCFHAESRKAPHIDGIVERDARGYEKRAIVSLSNEEQDICQRVSSAFDQFVIGFDLLRGAGNQPFIIDVNGWSMVKSSKEYAVRSGKLLADHVVKRLNNKVRQPSSKISSSHPMPPSNSQKSTKSSGDRFESSQSTSSTCAV